VNIAFAAVRDAERPILVQTAARGILEAEMGAVKQEVGSACWQLKASRFCAQPCCAQAGG
jgi:hypothetical protein